MKRVSRVGRNEMIKGASSWLRTLSLGFLAVAFLEPLRGTNSLNALQFGAAFPVGLFAFLLSMLTLTFMEDEP